MSYLINHGHIKSYLKCPLIYTRFSHEDKLPELDSLFANIIRHIFTIKYVHGEFNISRQVKIVWETMLYKYMKKDNYEQKSINSIYLLLHEIIKNILYRFDKYSVVGIDVPINYITEDIIYSDSIDVILSYNGEIFPLFVLHEFDNPRRDSKCRILTSLLKEQTTGKITEYIGLTVMKNKYKTIKIDNIKIKNKDAKLAIDELETFISLLKYKGVPNTNMCHSCEFISRCNL